MTRWAIEKDRITWAALALVAVGGVFAFFNLPQGEDPGFVIRTAMVAIGPVLYDERILIFFA